MLSFQTLLSRSPTRNLCLPACLCVRACEGLVPLGTASLSRQFIPRSFAGLATALQPGFPQDDDAGVGRGERSVGTSPISFHPLLFVARVSELLPLLSLPMSRTYQDCGGTGSVRCTEFCAFALLPHSFWNIHSCPFQLYSFKRERERVLLNCLVNECGERGREGALREFREILEWSCPVNLWRERERESL